jgi:S1-C subfamily serine protease
MRKKFTLKILFLTPIIAFLLSSLTYMIAYPGSLDHATNLMSDFSLKAISLLEEDTSPTIDEEALQKIKQDLLRDLPSQKGELSAETALNILATTVKISTPGSSGSGVVVFENIVDDSCFSYILTNQHVVADNENVTVSRYHYLRDATISSTVAYPGRVIGKDKDLDLALIEIETPSSIGPVATFDSVTMRSNLTLTQPIHIAGCPLGNPPLLTSGRIAFISSNRQIVTAFSLFGSSGGGVFTSEGKLIGISRGITMVQLSEESRIPEPNLSYTIPGPLIRSWLIVGGFSFVLDRSSHEDYLTNRQDLLNKK